MCETRLVKYYHRAKYDYTKDGCPITPIGIAIFHGFGVKKPTDFSGANYTVAIIEIEDGSVICVQPDCISFLNNSIEEKGAESKLKAKEETKPTYSEQMYTALSAVMDSYCLEINSNTESQAMRRARTLVGDVLGKVGCKK